MNPAVPLLVCAAAWAFVLALSTVLWRGTPRENRELRRFMRLSATGSALITTLALAAAIMSWQ